MRTTAWMSVLVLLVFGIGWTSRVLSESRGGSSGTALGGVASEVTDVGRTERGSERDRDRNRRGPPSRGRDGPWASSVTRFADRLAFDADQQSNFEKVMDEARQQVHEHEKAIWSVVAESREKILGILREDQRALLDALIQGERDQYREAEISQSMEWMRADAGLEGGALVSVEAMLRRYHDDLGKSVGSPFDQPEAPKEDSGENSRSGRSWDKKFRERQEALYSELASVLDVETLERFKSRNHWMHGDRRPGESEKR